MTGGLIDSVLELLASLPEVDRPLRLLELLHGDSVAASGGFALCLLAADATLAAKFAAERPDATALRPFREVLDWTVEERAAVERAGVLVAGTTARQLLLEPLIAALKVAASVGVPVATLVAGMGRLQDPAAAEARMRARLREALPSGATCTVACLGDSRYAGLALADALGRADKLHTPGPRERGLVAARTVEARAFLHDKVEELQASMRRASEKGRLLRDKEKAHAILARAEVAAWTQYLGPFRSALADTDPDSILDAAQREANGLEVITKATELLREQVRAALERVRGAAELALVGALQRFVHKLRGDLSRGRGDLGSDREDAADELLGDQIRQRLTALVEESSRALPLASSWQSLLVWLEGRGHARPDDPDSTGGPDSGAAAEPSEGDDRSARESQAERATRDLLAGMSRRFVRTMLSGAITRALAAGAERLEIAIDAALASWADLLRRTVEDRYAPLHREGQDDRSEVSSRLDAVLAVLKALDAARFVG